MIFVSIWYCLNSSAASRFSAEESARTFVRIRKGDEIPALSVRAGLVALVALVALAVLAVLTVLGVFGELMRVL